MKTFLKILGYSLAATAVVFFFLRWAMAQQGLEWGLFGNIVMALGTFFTMALGASLMALLFHSNRSGHDDIAGRHTPDDRDP